MIQPCRLASTERGRVNVERCKWEVCECACCAQCTHNRNSVRHLQTHILHLFALSLFFCKNVRRESHFHWRLLFRPLIYFSWMISKKVCTYINQIGAECCRWCLWFCMLCCAIRCRSSGPYMLMNIRAENRNWNMHWIGIVQIQQSLNNTKDRFTNSSCLYAHN